MYQFISFAQTAAMGPLTPLLIAILVALLGSLIVLLVRLEQRARARKPH